MLPRLAISSTPLRSRFPNLFIRQLATTSTKFKAKRSQSKARKNTPKLSTKEFQHVNDQPFRSKPQSSDSQKFYHGKQKVLVDASTAYDELQSNVEQYSRRKTADVTNQILELVRVPDVPSDVKSKVLSTIAQDIIDDTKGLWYDQIIVDATCLELRTTGQHSLAKALWESVKPRPNVVNIYLYYPMLLILADSKLETPWKEIEELYQEALHDPDAGTSATYHATPNAVLTQRNSSSIPYGVHDQLYHIMAAMARAQMMKGHLRDGYLSMDSVTRLQGRPPPKFFYEAMCDFHVPLSISEKYRLIRMANQNGMAVYSYKLRRVIRRSRVWQLQVVETILTERDLSEALRPIVTSFNLVATHIDAGGKIDNDIVSNLLIMLSRIMSPTRLPYDKLDAEWNDYLFSIAECANVIVKLFSPFMHGVITHAYLTLMRIAMFARHKTLFYTTLKQFLTGGGESEKGNRVLLVASGHWGSTGHIEKVWEELKAIRTDEGRVPTGEDIFSLTEAVKAQGDESSFDYLKDQLPEGHDMDALKDVLEPKKTEGLRDKFTLDAKRAKKAFITIFEQFQNQMHLIINKIDPSSRILDHESISKSLRQQPLASLEDMWTIYNKLAFDPDALKSERDEGKHIPLEEISEYPVLQRRFLHWVEINELLADRAQHEQVHKMWEKNRRLGIDSDREKLELVTSFRKWKGSEPHPEPAPFDYSERPPRFQDSEKLEKFIRNLRGIDAQVDTNDEDK